MAYTGAEHSLGMVAGYTRRRREIKAERQADEDRARSVRRDEANEAWTAEQRARTRQQWAEEDAEAPRREELRKLDFAELRAKHEREGSLEFLYDLDAGTDPATAVARYNQRGASKIDPKTVQLRGTRLRFAHSDTDGDGKPEVVDGELQDMIAKAERLLGRGRERKLHNVPAGATAIDPATAKPVYTNPKPAPGKRPIVVGPNSSVLDPDTLKPINVKGRNSGGGDPGGRKMAPFNPETYNRDLQGELARLVGGKYDPAAAQWDYGSASKKMPPFARIALEEAARINRTMPGAVPAQYIAALVADEASGYDEEAIRSEARENAISTGAVKIEGFPGLGKPNKAALTKIEDAAVQRALEDSLGRIRTGISFAEQNARSSIEQNALRAEAEAAAAESNESDGDETAENPDDTAPAIEWPRDAPPPQLFGKRRPGTRLKANGQVWVIQTDGTPKRVE